MMSIDLDTALDASVVVTGLLAVGLYVCIFSPQLRTLSEQSRTQEELKRLLDETIPVLWERGLPPSLASSSSSQQLTDPNKLRRRLEQIVLDENPAITWLTVPLLKGLRDGGDAINGPRLVIPGTTTSSGNSSAQQEGFPLLHWLCQFQVLRARFRYRGREEMVALALRAGAHVDATLSNGCTALFFAVKYSSPKTVEVLLQEGHANANLLDKFTQSCWKNAVEYPHPDIVTILAQYRPPQKERVPVTQLLPRSTSGAGNGATAGTTAVEWKTLTDLMLHNFISYTVDDKGQVIDCPTSWRILTLPKVEPYALALIRLLQLGVTLSTHEMGVAVCYHAASPRLALAPGHKAVLMHLNKVLWGEWLPEAIRKEVLGVNKPRQTSANTTAPALVCPMCKANSEELDLVELFCGHDICLECVQQQKPTECPACGVRLGRDVWKSTVSSNGQQKASRQRGPESLTDQQLLLECQARGLKDFKATTASRFSREEMIKLLQPTQTLPPQVLLELSATKTVRMGNQIVYLAPSEGPVVIPITVKSIPILAWLSPASPLTALSSTFVKTFGLIKTNLSSRSFVDIRGEQLPSRATVVADFAFFLGHGPKSSNDREIRLHNAISYDHLDHRTPFGVQLGRDFIEAARWTQCCVPVHVANVGGRPLSRKVQKQLFVRADGTQQACLVTAETRKQDELRYYTKDGRSFTVPFIHIENLDDGKRVQVIDLPSSINVMECEWCSRLFPSSMITCKGCEAAGVMVYYCNEICRKSAARLHVHQTAKVSKQS